MTDYPGGVGTGSGDNGGQRIWATAVKSAAQTLLADKRIPGSRMLPVDPVRISAGRVFGVLKTFPGDAGDHWAFSCMMAAAAMLMEKSDSRICQVASCQLSRPGLHR